MRKIAKVLIYLVVFGIIAVLMAAEIAYAEIPDVSKWSCAEKIIDPDYGVKIMICGDRGAHLKVSGELVYIHEHRINAGNTVYYNALKTNDGIWVETVNERDIAFSKENRIENNKEVVIMSFYDNDGNVIANRTVPKLK
jgi:hypothetical protein